MAKYIGHGTVLKVSTNIASTGGSTAATAVGNLISLGDLDSKMAGVDTTVIDDAVATKDPDIPTAGEMTAVLAYKQGDTGFGKLKTMHANRTKGIFYVVYASTNLSDDSFKGFVSGIGRGGIQRDQMIQRSIGLQPSSGLTWS